MTISSFSGLGSADVLNRLVLLVQSIERGVKILAEHAHVPQQFLFLAQELDGHGAGQRASAEGGDPCMPG